MKKKLLLSLCLMAIAVVAFCLWYTRPQTFWQATGMDRDNIPAHRVTLLRAMSRLDKPACRPGC